MENIALGKAIEARGKVEFVSQVLRLLAKEARVVGEIDSLASTLSHLKEMLDDAALSMFLIESELDTLSDDALSNNQNIENRGNYDEVQNGN